MMFLIIFALIHFCYSYNLNNPKPDYNNYKTPKWVYKNVYNHNKKYNKVTKKFLNNSISIDDEYALIKYYKLPFGILQPINSR